LAILNVLREIRRVPAARSNEVEATHWLGAASFVGLLGHDVLHHFLPGTSAEFWIGAVHVDAGQGEVEMRLGLRVVVGRKKPEGLVFVAGLQAGLFTSCFVFEVVDAPRALRPERSVVLDYHYSDHRALGDKPITTIAVSSEWMHQVPAMGRCLASDRITVDGMKVGYMYREEPVDDAGSGWHYFAGDENQQCADNPDCFGIYDLNTICNHDRAVIPYLSAPFGSAFGREAGSDLFQAENLETPENGRPSP
jgi:hypothetical protein